MTRSVYIKELDAEPSLAEKTTLRTRLRVIVQWSRDLHQREKQNLRDEISRIPGLMALLMRPRNGERWTAEDRAVLKVQLRSLGVVSLYVATLAIPGSAITLPLLAWWLDRRRWRRVKVPRIDELDGLDEESSTPPT